VSEQESFKVTDRRGRGDVAAGAALPAIERSDTAGPERGDRTGSSEFRAGAGPGLDALFMMFASSALASLGGGLPETGERTPDLEQARAAIDVLVMLRDKTRGNRTEHESRLLEDILYDLQMRFVSASRGSAQRGPA
jgi:hypothetical protein